MTESSVDTDKLNAASSTLSASTASPASVNVSRAATVASYQTSAKWGTEPAPARFQSLYTEYLQYLEHELAVMRDQLEAFVDAAKHTADAVEQNEEDVAAAAARMDQRLTETAVDPTRVRTDSRTEDHQYKPTEDSAPVPVNDPASAPSSPSAPATSGTSGGYSAAGAQTIE